MKKGFSYIEVMLAGIILSILIIPVVATFYQAMNNQRFAMLHYKGILNAQSILAETLIMIHDYESIDNYFKEYIEKYDISTYAYTMYVSRLDYGGTLELDSYFATAQELVDLNVFSQIYFEESFVMPHSENYVLDMNEIVNINGVTINQNEIHFLDTIERDYSINIFNVSEDLHIYNLSDYRIFITVYTDSSNLEHDEKNNIYLYTNTSSILLNYKDIQELSNYFVVLDVYSKEEGTLIQRFARML